ncbi:hypothetical protein TKK_0009620 [Trichogramma kaykai]
MSSPETSTVSLPSGSERRQAGTPSSMRRIYSSSSTTAWWLALASSLAILSTLDVAARPLIDGETEDVVLSVAPPTTAANERH